MTGVQTCALPISNCFSSACPSTSEAEIGARRWCGISRLVGIVVCVSLGVGCEVCSYANKGSRDEGEEQKRGERDLKFVRANAMLNLRKCKVISFIAQCLFKIQGLDRRSETKGRNRTAASNQSLANNSHCEQVHKHELYVYSIIVSYA